MTLTVKFVVPDVVGVPMQLATSREAEPAGTEPEATLQEYGVVLGPDALRVAQYVVPSVPAGREVVVTSSGEATCLKIGVKYPKAATTTTAWPALL